MKWRVFEKQISKNVNIFLLWRQSAQLPGLHARDDHCPGLGPRVVRAIAEQDPRRAHIASASDFWSSLPGFAPRWWSPHETFDKCLGRLASLCNPSDLWRTTLLATARWRLGPWNQLSLRKGGEGVSNIKDFAPSSARRRNTSLRKNHSNDWVRSITGTSSLIPNHPTSQQLCPIPGSLLEGMGMMRTNFHAPHSGAVSRWRCRARNHRNV